MSHPDAPLDVKAVRKAGEIGRRTLIKIGAGLLAGLAAVCKGGGVGPPPSPVDRMPLPGGDPTVALGPFTIATTDSFRHETLADLMRFRPMAVDEAGHLRHGWQEALPPDTMAELMRLHARDEAPR